MYVRRMSFGCTTSTTEVKDSTFNVAKLRQCGTVDFQLNAVQDIAISNLTRGVGHIHDFMVHSYGSYVGMCRRAPARVIQYDRIRTILLCTLPTNAAVWEQPSSISK